VRSTSPAAVIGLDLSLRGSGVVVLPSEWNPKTPWRDLTYARLGEQGKLDGFHRVAGIVGYVEQVVERSTSLEKRRRTKVFVEEHAFSMGLQKYAYARAELVGAVKHALWGGYGIETFPVVASHARKLLFGKMPKMSRKEWKKVIEIELGKMGAPFEDEDTRDAFLICNAGLEALRMPCLAHG
jgi:hypothetical protein